MTINFKISDKHLIIKYTFLVQIVKSRSIILFDTDHHVGYDRNTAKSHVRIRMVKLNNKIKLDWYSILEDRVETGINYGYRRAYKHTNTPTEEEMKMEILNAVMTNLCEVIREVDTDENS